MPRPKVGEILIAAGLIDEMQLNAALGDQNNWGQRLGVTLVKMGLVEERDLVQALAKQLQLPVVGLEGKRVQPEVLELVPGEFAEKHLCVPLFVKDGPGGRTLFVGMDDPCDVGTIDELGFSTGMKVQAVLVSPSELCEAIDRFYHRSHEREIELSVPASGLDLETGGARRKAGFEHVPNVEESIFPEVLEIDSGPATREEHPAPPVRSARPEETTDRTILRALCHLLIEKRIIDRDELQRLIASVESAQRRS